MNHIRRSPRWRSQLRPWFLRCSIRIPPWRCTIAFGRPVVPGREEDVERVVERDRVELERPGLADQVVPSDRVRQRVVGSAGVRHVHHVLERRQRRADLRDLGAAVDRLVAVAVAGDRQQHLGLDDAEAVDHAARPELRRAGGPHRAEARGGQEGHQRLGDVRHVGDDAIAGADAEPAQPGARGANLLAQVGEAQLERVARLRDRQDGDLGEVLVAADHVLGVVERGALETTRRPASRRRRARARRACGP